MSIELKVKSKHLGEEARIIRFEERKQLERVRRKLEKIRATGQNDINVYEMHHTYRSLNHHRRWDVRNENRATFLARAYLAGVPYSNVEQTRKDDVLLFTYILPRVYQMVSKYGTDITNRREWDKVKQRYVPTEQLKDEILDWINNT